jgi:pyrimidine-nucleoside phosphorylase
MLLVELIRRKRDGKELTREEIEFIVSGYTSGEFPDYQISAFLMAALIRGLSGAETAALTQAMLHSGQVLDFSDLPGKKVDKHSTGGVGDKTSLILSPIVAAAGGVKVPMISGRGLGHTGGTLDKLESIPGFNVNLTLAQFRDVLAKIGCAMIGQTAEVAPADKKLYSLRDVTGTVESPFLICASIMSKKLAEGVDGLVLDVKTGSGAFMKKEDDAVYLAELMVDTGERMGKKMVALITDMDQPLGMSVGNALEVEECIEVMRGKGSEDLRVLTLELCSWMFYLAERTATVLDGYHLAEEMISSGKALDKFRELIEIQGGDPQVIDYPSRLPHAMHRVTVHAKAEGFVTAMDCERIGIAGVMLGGGRQKKEDSVDPAVGIVLNRKTGQYVQKNDTLCFVHYNSDANLEEVIGLLQSAYVIGPHLPLEPRPLIHRVIKGKSVS